MSHPNSFGRAFVYAGEGIWTALASERNLRVHVTVALAIAAGGWLFALTAVEWMAVVLAFGLVMALELMNTAVEALADLASPEIHPLAKRAKDTAAGAVLVAAMAALALGLVVFVPRLPDFGHDFMVRWHQSPIAVLAVAVVLAVALGLLWGVVPRHGRTRRRPEPFR
ncbi:diacylglycerol kinase [Sulfobacillus harzensis]|uniref:Diacylglycerol kinase family protein n=1 Tax=Sulfobacillus harzensis TaxID=2729629 RepID=A0A7Y0L481_9FIRM|nr:diacylglycerol kinase family protein [Sulfobacillus harzensis]